MSDNYGKIIQDNLSQLYGNLPIDLSENLPGEQVGEQFHFDAFGEKCVIDPKRIILGEGEHSSVIGLIISVYALNPKFPDYCNEASGVTPNWVYRFICRFVVSPTCSFLPGTSKHSMMSKSSNTSCIV